MPVLLAVLLAIVLAAGLMLALLPLSLWQRYRVARSRRLAIGWVAGLAWWSTVVSSALMVLSTALAGLLWPLAWSYVAMAYPAGLALGAAGHALTRFEATANGLYYRSNAWLVSALAVLVVVRLVAGLVQTLRVWTSDAQWPAQGWLSHAGLLAVGALLLGYATAQAWGLRHRLRQYQRHRGYDRSPR